MYIYHNGLIIREGTKGIKPEALKKLYSDAGWIGKEFPNWQIEKFTISLENSTWAFTVWDKEEMIGLVRVLSDKVMFATIHDLIVLSSYRGRGIGKELVGLCIQKLPHGAWHAYTTPNNYKFYEKCGFEFENARKNACGIYSGYTKAREQGHR